VLFRSVTWRLQEPPGPDPDVAFYNTLAHERSLLYD
jgi:hypothetical protein